MTTNTLQTIAEIDARRAELDKQLAPLNEAMRRALDMGADAEEEVADLTVERRRTVADFLLGLTGRAQVDGIEAAHKKSRAKAEAAAAARELAALGAAEIGERMRPMNEELVELGRQRDALQRRAIRERAEAAGERYREAIENMAKAYSELQAHAETLNDLEHVGMIGVPVTDDPQGFGGHIGPQQITLPIFPSLAAFKTYGTPAAVVNFWPGFSSRDQIAVDHNTTRARVQTELRGAGLLNR